MIEIISSSIIIALQIKLNEVLQEVFVKTKVRYIHQGHVEVISLAGGSYYDMGVAYGATLNNTLVWTRNKLVMAFVQNNVTYGQMVVRANQFYERYPYEYQVFLQGIAGGSGLSFNDVKILNGMETLNSLIKSTSDQDIVHCAFVSIPPHRTYNKQYSIIGRNYDFPPSIYGEIATRLVVAVINAEDAVPTAIIGMPGQIYCPSCTNQQGLFMELNNGMPSGGYYLNQGRETMLVNMLKVMQQSPDLESMHHQMMALQSDYSLIVSTANATYAQSYEYSSNSSLGMKPYSPEYNQVLVYTNFYLNQSWENEIPVPNDHDTWDGVTRRDNLLQLAHQHENFTLASMQELMEVPLEDGGALWNMTIYQIIFLSENNTLSLRSIFGEHEWTNINLDDWYQN